MNTYEISVWLPFSSGGGEYTTVDFVKCDLETIKNEINELNNFKQFDKCDEIPYFYFREAPSSDFEVFKQNLKKNLLKAKCRVYGWGYKESDLGEKND